MSLYEVSGRLAYRGYQPGELFEAILDEQAEQRALARGSIRVVERSTPSLQPGSVTLPPGWPNRKAKEG